MNERNLPSRQQIFNHWYDHKKFVELEIQVGNSDCCMACGFDYYVERCHLKAVSIGGSDDVSNLHILCKNCHVESENLNEKWYWIWLQNKNKNFKLSVFNQTDIVGRERKEFIDLIKEQKFYEAAVWTTEPFENDSEEERQKLVAEYKKLYGKLNPQ